MLGLLLLVYLAGAAFSAVTTPLFRPPDEDAHFEYAQRLIALGRPPGVEDIDPVLRQWLAAAALADAPGFWQPRAVALREQRVLFSADSPFPGELGAQPPLYYVLLAPVLKLSAAADIRTQVILARLVSALLGAGVLALTYAAVRTARPRGETPSLAAAAAALIALVPQFTFVMAAVNNDALAALLGAALFYLGVRLLRRGPTRWTLAGLLLVAGLLPLVKGTALSLLLALPLLPLLGAWRRWPAVRRGLLLAAAAAGLLLVALPPAWNAWAYEPTAAPQHWRVAPGTSAQIVADPTWPAGGGLRLSRETASGETLIGQYAPRGQGPVVLLRGRPLTAGIWVRAAGPSPTRVRLSLHDASQSAIAERPVAAAWQWLSARLTVSPTAAGVLLEIATESPDDPAPPTEIWLAAASLAAGDFDRPPERLEADGNRLVWAGHVQDNLLANGTFRQAETRLRPPVAATLARLGGERTAQRLTDSVRRADLTRLPAAFWPYAGTFGYSAFASGWAGMTLDAAALAPRWLPQPLAPRAAQDRELGPPALVVLLLAGLLLIGLAGNFRRRAGRGDGAVAILAAGLVLASVLVIGLSHVELYATWAIWPQGRYFYPALAPLAYLFVRGARAWLPPPAWRPALIGGLALGFSAQAAVAVGLTLPFYFSS